MICFNYLINILSPIEIPDGLLINKFHEGGYFGD